MSSETNSVRSGRALSCMDCLSEVNVYLSHVPVSDDEPALLFAWSRENLDLFVDAANDKRRQRRRHKAPVWFSQSVGSITPQSLIGDVMNHFAQASGGRFGSICLAPNSKTQLGDILVRLAEFEAEPFVQRCMRDVPAGQVVVTMATLRDRQAVATSARSIPRRPQALRLFFA